jgi:hypothetical protein
LKKNYNYWMKHYLVLYSSTTQSILSLASIGEEFLKFLERYNTERDENIKQLEQIYDLIGQHTELFGTMAETINNIRNN